MHSKPTWSGAQNHGFYPGRALAEQKLENLARAPARGVYCAQRGRPSVARVSEREISHGRQVTEEALAQDQQAETLAQGEEGQEGQEGRHQTREVDAASQRERLRPRSTAPPPSARLWGAEAQTTASTEQVAVLSAVGVLGVAAVLGHDSSVDDFPTHWAAAHRGVRATMVEIGTGRNVHSKFS